MNILILADHFPPSFAPRMGYLVRNLKDMGHRVYVVAITRHRDFNSFGFLTGYADEVYEVEGQQMSHSKVALSTVKGFMTTLRPMWTETDTQYYKQAKKALKEHNIDCVLCSTSSFYPLMVVKKLMGKKLPVVLDFRDIYEQDESFFSRKGFGGVMRHFQKKIRNKVISKADAVVSVTNWHCQYLSMWNPNTRMILNGFDEQRFYPQAKWKGEKTRIVYTGTIATPQGDISAHSPEILLEAIEELDVEKRKRLEVVFYTDENSGKVVSELVRQRGLTDVMKVEEWVSSEKVPQVLAESTALLILTNHGSKGMMMTKSYEYMAMGRPILCLPDPYEQLEKLLEESKTGVVLRDKERVKETLEALIEDRYEIQPDLEVVKRYSRKAQAQQFADLMTEVIENKNE